MKTNSRLDTNTHTYTHIRRQTQPEYDDEYDDESQPVHKHSSPLEISSFKILEDHVYILYFDMTNIVQWESKECICLQNN